MKNSEKIILFGIPIDSFGANNIIYPQVSLRYIKFILFRLISRQSCKQVMAKIRANLLMVP